MVTVHRILSAFCNAKLYGEMENIREIEHNRKYYGEIEN